MRIHPIIAAFERQAKILDLTSNTQDSDDAIALLAGWLEQATNRLTDADLHVIVNIGGLLYRDGLSRRADASNAP
ncbi:hypothetical protein RSSE_c3266 [Ralstonia solanacearum]|nr:hypothetical protein RSSE_c3266 [Ralstonia solanacearum]